MFNLCHADSLQLSWIEIFRNSTAFITAMDTSTNKTLTGTGFIAYYNDSINDIYLVTNRHILQGNHVISFQLPLFLHTIKGDTVLRSARQWIDLFDSKGNRRWKALEDTTIDIAAIRIKNEWKYDSPKVKVIDFKAYALPFSFFADSGMVNDDLTGSFVYFAGYPLGFHGQVSPYPLIRFGFISSVHGKELFGKDAIIVDGSGFSGSSGSPVCTWAVNYTKNGLDFSRKPKLIGIIDSYYSYPDAILDNDAEITDDNKVDTVGILFKTKENVHLINVQPIHLIRRTLALFDKRWMD